MPGRNIGSGQSVQASWRVSVPGGADPQIAALTVQSTYTRGGQRGVTNASADVLVPYPSLAAAFTNTGITADSSPAAGAPNGANPPTGRHQGMHIFALAVG